MVIALLELFEAEGRTLRRETLKVGQRLALLRVAAFIVAAGAALIGWALFIVLANWFGSAVAALILGLLALAIGGGLFWWTSQNKN